MSAQPCPRCSTPLIATENRLGSILRCPRCGSTVAAKADIVANLVAAEQLGTSAHERTVLESGLGPVQEAAKALRAALQAAGLPVSPVAGWAVVHQVALDYAAEAPPVAQKGG